jgi:hypothetical protein
MSPNDTSGLIKESKHVKPSAFMSQIERHPPLVLNFVPLASGVWLRAFPAEAGGDR